jgi:hypothetical protein
MRRIGQHHSNLCKQRSCAQLHHFRAGRCGTEALVHSLLVVEALRFIRLLIRWLTDAQLQLPDVFLQK